MPVTAEEVAAAAAMWVRAKRRSRKAAVIKHCRDRLEALAGHWMSESNDFTQSQVGNAPTVFEGNRSGTREKAA